MKLCNRGVYKYFTRTGGIGRGLEGGEELREVEEEWGGGVEGVEGRTVQLGRGAAVSGGGGGGAAGLQREI